METHVQFMKFTHLKPFPDGCEPEARSGHRIVADNGNLYSIGGYNPRFWDVENDDETYYPLFRELWQFNLATKKWRKLQTKGYMPKELASHSAILHGHHLVVMGGTGVPFGEMASNKLHVCNLRTLQWSHINASGEMPIPSYGHSMMIVDDYLYVFGGTTGWQYNSELHSLHLGNYDWSLIEPQANCNYPEGRYRHEMAYHDKKFFILGGGRAYTSYKFDDIPVFNLETRLWRLLPSIPDNQHGAPAERRCHSCVQLRDSAYMCGGYNGEVIFGDIWRLFLPQLQWTKLQVTMPKPAYFHSAALTPSGCMLVYGGVTKIEDVRTSDVYALWLRLPTLKELCWSTMTNRMANLDRVLPETLLEAGIPPDLIDRLPLPA